VVFTATSFGETRRVLFGGLPEGELGPWARVLVGGVERYAVYDAARGILPMEGPRGVVAVPEPAGVSAFALAAVAALSWRKRRRAVAPAAPGAPIDAVGSSSGC
jgi:hypothetical protein